MIKRKIEITPEEVTFILTLKKHEIFDNPTRKMLFDQISQNKIAGEQLEILTEIVKEVDREHNERQS